jgi:hypothetical protein
MTHLEAQFPNYGLGTVKFFKNNPLKVGNIVLKVRMPEQMLGIREVLAQNLKINRRRCGSDPRETG